MQIFLSHSSKDAAIAGQICEQLEKNGAKCFIAPRDIRPGKEYAEEIINGIDKSAAMVLLMSQNANSSPHVLREDETQAVLVASHILTMKAYDAAESGRYNYDGDKDYWTREFKAGDDMALQARVRGNSDWSVSNLRTWLNADTEVVAYSDQPPAATAMAEKKNGYQNEAGFLCGFTREECDAIVETELFTKGNALSESGSVTTHDRVWLLSLDELAWFDEAGMSKYASPTEEAVRQDQSNWYSLDYDTYKVEYCSWWLREPVPEAASLCYLVNNGYAENVTRQENAGLEGFGVRPALVVDLRLVTFRTAESGE